MNFEDKSSFKQNYLKGRVRCRFSFYSFRKPIRKLIGFFIDFSHYIKRSIISKDLIFIVRKNERIRIILVLATKRQSFCTQIKPSLLKHFFWITKYSKVLKSPEVNHFLLLCTFIKSITSSKRSPNKSTG
jgi:hypothetical protein